eukprot:scaffold103562_cov64-Phaeocystis_antarctica.AAC.3
MRVIFSSAGRRRKAGARATSPASPMATRLDPERWRGPRRLRRPYAYCRRPARSRPAARQRPALPPAAACHRDWLTFRRGKATQALAAPSQECLVLPGQPQRGLCCASRASSPRAAPCSSAAPP